MNITIPNNNARERPILMNAAMVRAVLNGTKTQTRRIAPLLLPGDKNYIFAGSVEEWVRKRSLQCPYGQIGDRLWVREAFCYPNGQNKIAWYRADSPWANDALVKWKPSIHMPRQASRITLEIVNVRVERLQDISEADAIAEGCHQDSRMNGAWTADGDTFTSKDDGPVRAYRMLWESINGKGSWAANPWVWVIELKVAQP